MTEPSSTIGKSLTIDEFIALNDEMSSLLKAGVPLDLGLKGFASSVSGRLSNYSSQISHAVGRGESLEDAVQTAGEGLPAAYRAVIRAGAESGRLPEAFELLAEHARQVRETRSQLSLAMIYPVIVCIVAYCLLWGFTQYVAPTVVELSVKTEALSRWTIVSDLAAKITSTLGVFPVIVLVVLLVWMILPLSVSSQNAALNFRRLRGIPGMSFVQRCWDLSVFARFSARLLDHGLPAPQAFRLSAEATGDQALIDDAQLLAGAMEQGDPAGAVIDRTKTFPPLMKWMLKAAEQQSAMIPTLDQLADYYQRRAAFNTERMQLIFPVAATVVIGGGVAAFYALAIFTPITDLLYGLSLESM